MAATLPADWPQEQSFEVSTTGLVKISLPKQTLDAARPTLEDLRLCDGSGNEVPYLVEHPKPSKAISRTLKSFQIALNANATVMTLETGVLRPLSGVTLETPAENFIKAVRVESSPEGKSWRTIARGQPIFRQPFGASQLEIQLPAAIYPWLRLAVDDQRSVPIPFTGAQVHVNAEPTAPGEWVSAAITARDENPGETRLTLDLGAANLNLASLQITTSDPLLTRPVTLAIPQITENYAGEETIGRGTIYRIAVDGQSPSENLAVPLATQIRSRELLLFIKNGDSPPLRVAGVRVESRPVWLAFLARQPGTYHLLSGNRHCAAPNYDLTGLNLNLGSVTVLPVTISPPGSNPNYHAPEVLAGVTATGTALDVSDWGFRKPVKITSDGAQQLELDLDVVAHALPSLTDVRVMHGSNQVPYVIQRTSISRALTPGVTSTNDARQGNLSRWIIHLPRSHLPLTRLTCTSRTPVFERSISFYEELTNERGDPYRYRLGEVSWRQTPEHPARELALTFDYSVRGDTLFLETDNLDNPPIELENFKVHYPVTRLLFKARADDELYLYYGNLRAASPSYDLNLEAGQLLAADKKAATLAGEERLKKSMWHEHQKAQMPGPGGVIFWGMLAVVVVVLLAIISRLLPKSPPSVN